VITATSSDGFSADDNELYSIRRNKRLHKRTARRLKLSGVGLSLVSGKIRYNDGSAAKKMSRGLRKKYRALRRVTDGELLSNILHHE